MKITRLLFLALLFGILVTAAWNPVRVYLLQNHVVFLLNQKRLDEADTLVQRLVQHEPENVRSWFLRDKINILLRRKGQERTELEDKELLEKYPKLYYWRALQYYHEGNLTASSHCVDMAVGERVRLPDDASNRLLVLLKTGESNGSEDPVPVAMQGQLFAIEKEVLFTKLGLQRQVEGKFGQAASYYSMAYERGMRAESFLSSATLNALFNEDFAQADFFVSQCRPRFRDWLYEKFRSDFETSNLNADVLVIAEEMKSLGPLEIARSLSWIAPYYIRQDIQSRRDSVIRQLSDIQSRYPYNLMLQLQLGRSLEAAEMRVDALVMYSRLLAESRALQVELKVWLLKGMGDDEIVANVAKFMDKVPHLKVAGGAESGGEVLDIIRENATREYEVMAAKSGDYAVTVIARNLPGKSFQSVMPVRVGDSAQTAGFFCVSSQDWDCFRASVHLSRGVQTLKIGCELLPGDAEMAERSIQIMGVYVTETGVN